MKTTKSNQQKVRPCLMLILISQKWTAKVPFFLELSDFQS